MISKAFITDFPFEIWLSLSVKANWVDLVSIYHSILADVRVVQKALCPKFLRLFCFMSLLHSFNIYYHTVLPRESFILNDLLSQIAPKLYSYGLTLVGYNYNSNK